MPEFRLAVDDAIELAETVTFLDDWLASAGPVAAESLAGFVGSQAYSVEELRADLARFVVLLGGSSVAERAFEGEPF
ncbi:hypothetical protein [Nocardia sp. NPDC003979]